MSSILPVLSFLLVVIVSMIVVRVASVALVLTGLSQQLARFQARSAFTGAGFTTSESEKVTQHPVRRKIVGTLMLLGNAGIVTAVSSLMLSFVNNGESASHTLWLRVLFIASGVAAVWMFAHSKWVDQHLTRLIKHALNRWTELDARDYSGLLHLARGYSVVEMKVESGDWLAERELASLKLSDEGVLVLGVDRANGEYTGAPRGKTRVSPGDTVIMYGPRESMSNLDNRRSGTDGNWEHHKAVDRLRREESQAHSNQTA